jgi:hypothetical protein
MEGRMKRPSETTRAVAVPAPRPVDGALWMQFLAAVAALVALSSAAAGALR